jgi:hypothetical protein
VYYFWKSSKSSIIYKINEKKIIKKNSQEFGLATAYSFFFFFCG